MQSRSIRFRWSWLFAVALAGTLSMTVHAQSAAKLTADDYAEILQLYFRYPLVLDSGDAEGYAALFTDDGSFGDRVGRQALLDFVRMRPATTVRHAPLTPVIIATPEGARGAVLNMFIDVGKTPAVVTRVTQYTDTLVKTQQGWRFKTRVNGTAELAAPAAPGTSR